ncbi:MAG: tetratricopeptide repeat protein [Proteobacteria bacterium]|nr:tetratricopeptide repeat protein [Pseudomonadota bacterium]
MKWFSRVGLTVVALTLAGTFPPGDAWGDWRKIASIEREVVFNPPGLEASSPRVGVSVNDDMTGRSEWMCWNGFGSLNANACITYQKTGVRGFEYSRVTDIPGRYGTFKGATHELVGKVQGVPSVLGDFDTIRMKVETKLRKKDCVLFSKFFSGTTKFIQGWYCARVGKDLAAETIAETISTIGLKGKKVPSGTPALAASAPVRAPSAQLADASKALMEARREGKALYEAGKYEQAIPLHRRALELGEREFGPDHPTTSTLLNNLAVVYRAQGRYEAAEPLHKRALAIWEKALGPDHPDVATGLNNLAGLFKNLGRYEAAEPLYKRALAIREKALGPDHPSVATTLNNLAGLYHAQGRYEAAEPLLKRALAIDEKVLGPEHPDFGIQLNNLADLYRAQGRYEAAEPLYKRALAVWEKTLGPDHPNVAHGLNSLARLYHALGRYDAAEPLHKRALAVWEKALGPDHPLVATSLNNLAALYQSQGRYEEALDHIRRATTIRRARAMRAGTTRSAGVLKEQASIRFVFLRHVDIVETIIERAPKRRTELFAEAFEVGQLARASETGAAVARMATRFSTGDDTLAHYIRERQDGVARWRALDAKLTEALGQAPEQRDAVAEDFLRTEMASLGNRIDGLDKTLARHFPEYAQLANPQPLALPDAQALLGPEEALIAYLVSERSTYLWAIRNDRADLHRIDIGRQDLEDAVTFVRAGLDQPGVASLGDIRRFDVDEAVALYQQIFAPAEPMLEGVRHVFVVPDGALQSLPLGVLITEEPKGRVRKLSAYRDVEWLAKKYAMTVLPSASSLRALRQFAKAALAKKPFVGFGDPALEGETGRGRGIDATTLFTRGKVADVAQVRRLARLPDTGGELRALGRSLNAGEQSIFLGDKATEARVRAMDLSPYRIVAFATHGLVAGDFEGVVEPGLVLTPPETGTEADDGFLSASEIATLKLDADLVILSACNTAAADGTPGAEGLSGLAKAFFYAGARALLVSHWPVVSDAAVAITTGMLDEMADDPDIGRAEALRRSMLAMMETEGKDYFAHPMFWAPFVVVGEGGRAAAE